MNQFNASNNPLSALHPAQLAVLSPAQIQAILQNYQYAPAQKTEMPEPKQQLASRRWEGEHEEKKQPEREKEPEKKEERERKPHGRLNACRYFAIDGECDDDCEYSHDPEAIEILQKLMDKMATQHCKYGANCQDGRYCLYRHPANPKPCKFFEKSGNCKFGRKCTFLHDYSE
jgi:hypothetical protein